MTFSFIFAIPFNSEKKRLLYGCKREKSNIVIAYCNDKEWIKVRVMQNNGFKYEIQFCLDNSIILFKSNIRLLLYSRSLII